MPEFFYIVVKFENSFFFLNEITRDKFINSLKHKNFIIFLSWLCSLIIFYEINYMNHIILPFNQLCYAILIYIKIIYTKIYKYIITHV